MRRAIISELILLLREEYGVAYRPWGTSDSEHEGTGFVIAGLPVFFSILSFGDIPEDELDVQIDSDVQVPRALGYDRYLMQGRYSVRELMALIEEFRRPIDEWPNVSLK